MDNQTTTEKFEQWAIVELMGHVKLAGRVTEEKRFGVEMGRIDIPQNEDAFVTQYFGGASVYRITPTTEEIARSVAQRNQPAPVHRWELPALESPNVPRRAPELDDEWNDAEAVDAENDPDYNFSAGGDGDAWG